MSQLFQETPLKGLMIYNPPLFRDERGFFMESYNAKHFIQIGVEAPFVQDNRSFSKKGTLRGLHLQLGDHAQAKLVGVLSGRVYDVAVDLRKGSESFGKYYGMCLEASVDPCFLYVPRGFAHGFMVLSDTAEFYYKVDNFYNKESEAGLHYNDPHLSIDWPKLDCELILSDKDKILPKFDEFVSEYGGKV